MSSTNSGAGGHRLTQIESSQVTTWLGERKDHYEARHKSTTFVTIADDIKEPIPKGLGIPISAGAVRNILVLSLKWQWAIDRSERRKAVVSAKTAPRDPNRELAELWSRVQALVVRIDRRTKDVVKLQEKTDALAIRVERLEKPITSPARQASMFDHGTGQG